MKSTKRLLCLLLVLVLAVVTVTAAVSAEDETEERVKKTEYAFKGQNLHFFKAEGMVPQWGELFGSELTYENGGYYFSTVPMEVGDKTYDYYSQANCVFKNVPAMKKNVYIDVTNNTNTTIIVKLAAEGYYPPDSLPRIRPGTTDTVDLGVLTAGAKISILLQQTTGRLPVGLKQFYVSAIYSYEDEPEIIPTQSGQPTSENQPTSGVQPTTGNDQPQPTAQECRHLNKKTITEPATFFKTGSKIVICLDCNKIISSTTLKVLKLGKPIIRTARLKKAVKISWKKINGATGYTVQMKQKGKWKTVKNIKKGGTVSYKKTGLKSKTKYSFRVRAIVKSGAYTLTGAYSAVKSAKAK